MERHPLRRFYGRTMFFKGALFASTALVFPLVPPRAALAQISQGTTPQGGVVVGGSASIAQAPGNTTVNQSSQLAAINWQSFNVGSAAKVQFNQPDAAAVALNRVVGGNLSQINGQISANGQIVLINQSGVVFGKGAQVNAESVVVSTSDIATSDFMAGKMNFTGAPKPGAQIINNGNITARDAGLVGLVAPQVLNNGVITAQLGQVVLAGGSAFTLDLYGDRLISLDVTQAVRSVDVNGQLIPALVTNSGLILANGGKVTLTAQDADALVTQLIAAGGTIQANTVGAQTGTISISGVGGNIDIAGNLLAQGTAPGQKGGAVQALTDGTVAVAPTAIIDASGPSGGGVIAIGTDLTRAQTGPTDTLAPAASRVSIAQGATIRADATALGNGGTVTLLSQNLTTFNGEISTQGGPQGGDGGLAEISSRGLISLAGTVLETAISGQPGEILLDPASIIVTAAGGSDSTTASLIDSNWLAGLSGSIVLSASTVLEVLSDVISTKLNALTLVSGGNVSLEASIQLTGSLEVDAGGSIYIGPSVASDIGGIITYSDAGLNANDIYLNGTTGIDIGAKILVNAGGTLELDSPDGPILGSTLIGGTALLPVTISDTIQTPTLTGGTASIGGNVVLDNPANAIATLNNLTLGTGDSLLLNDAAALAIGNVSAPSATFTSDDTAGNAFAITGNLNAPTLLSFSSNQPVLEAATGTITTATLELSGTATPGITVSLASAHNAIGALGPTSFVSQLILADNNLLTIANPIGIASGFTLAGAGITESGSGALTVPDFTGTLITGAINLGGVNAIGTIALSTAGTINLDDSGVLDIPTGITGSSVFLNIPAGSTLVLGGTAAGAAGGTLDATGTGGILQILANAITVNPGTSLDPSKILAANGTLLVAPITGTDNIFVTGATNATSDATTLLLGGNFVAAAAGNETLLEFGDSGFGGNVTFGGGSTDNINLGAVSLDVFSAAAASQILETGTLSATSLSFTAGGLTQNTGAILLTNLAGTATGNIALAGAANVIATLGPISGTNILINDSQTGNLILSDNLTANTIANTNTGTISLDNEAGGITQNAGQITAATLTSGGATNGGTLNFLNQNAIGAITSLAATGDIDLSDQSALTIEGPITAGGQLELQGGTAGISETPNAIITAATLTDGGGLLRENVFLTGANDIATLAAFGVLTPNTFALTNAPTNNLTIAGPVSGAALTLGGGTLFLDGNLTGTTALELDGAKGIDQTAGSLTTGTLNLSALTSGDISLTAAGNSFGTLAAATLKTGSLFLADKQDLDITSLVATPGEFYLSVTSIAETGNGAINAATLDFGSPSLSSVSLNGTNTIASLAGDLALVTGDFRLNDADFITLTTPLTIQGTAAFSGAGLTESSSGFLAAETLAGTITANPSIPLSGDLLLTNTNAIGVVDGLTLAGTLILNNIDNLSVGSLDADTATFSNPNAGDVLNFISFASIAHALDLDFSTIAEPVEFNVASGAISAATLTTDTIINSLSLVGANTIGTIGAFTATQGFALSDTANLDIAGALSAHAIALAAPEILLNAPVNAPFSFTAGTVELITNSIVQTSPTNQFSAPGGLIELEPYSSAPFSFSPTEFDSYGTLVIGSLATGNPFPPATPGGSSPGETLATLTIHNANFGTGSNVILYASDGISDLGTLTAGTLAFAGGGFIQTTPTAALVLTSLTADGLISGLVSLASTLNQIGTLGAIDDTADVTLTDGISLNVIGAISAQNIALADASTISLAGATLTADTTTGTLALYADTLTASAGASLTAATVQLAPYDTADAIDLGGSTHTGLQLSDALLNIIGAGILRIGTAGGGTIYTEGSVSISAAELVLTGQSIDILGSLQGTTNGTLNSTLSLAAAGNVSEAPTAGFAFNTLTGFGNDVIITGTNNVATLAAFSAASNLAFKDDQALSIAGSVTTQGTISLEDPVAGITEITGGTIAAGTLDSGGTTIDGDLFLTISNTLGAIGGLTIAAGNTFGLTNANATTLTIAGTLQAPNANITAGNFIIAGGLDGTYLHLSSPGSITETTGTIAVSTLTGSATGAITLLDPNQIGTITNLTAGGPIGLYDAQILTIAGLITTGSALTLQGTGALELSPGTIDATILSSGGTAITGNVSLQNANTIATLTNFTISGPNTLTLNDAVSLGVAGGVTVPTAYLTASSIGFSGVENFATLLALQSPGEILQSTGTITAGALTSLGSIGADTEFLGQNHIATLANFSVASGSTLAVDDAATASLNVAGFVTAPFATLAAGTIDITGSISGTELALESPGNVFESGSGAIRDTILTTGNTTIGGTLALIDANLINTLAAAAALGGITLDNFQTLAIAGLVYTPATLILQALGDVTESAAGIISAGTFGSEFPALPGSLTAGSISGTLSLLNQNSITAVGNLEADSGIALNNVTPLTIAGFVTTAGTLTLEGNGGIGETGAIAAAELDSGSLGYDGNVALTGANTIPAIGGFTTPDTFELLDNTDLAVGLVNAASAIMTAPDINIEGGINAGLVDLGATGQLAESSGTIDTGTLGTLQASAGTQIILGNKFNTIGTIGGLTAGSSILLNDGVAETIAGLISTPTSLTLEDATAGITEIAGGTIAAATLNSGFLNIGGDVRLQNPNTIATLGAFLAPSHTLALNNVPTLTLAGNLTAGTLLLQDLADVTEIPGGTITAATLATTGPGIGGALTLLNLNAITTLAAITAAGDIFINDGIAETIAGLITTGQIITLTGAPSITETTGGILSATELTAANTTIGGNVILNSQNTLATLANIALATGSTLALTDTEILTLAGTVTASDAAFTVPGLTIDGVQNDGQVLALTSATSVIENPGGGIIAGTLTSLGTVDGDIILAGTQNTIGVISNFTVGTANTFDLADTAPLTIAGPLTGGFVTLAAEFLSIASTITAPTLVLEALTGITENTAASLIDTALSAGGIAIGGPVEGAVLLAGVNTIATLGDLSATGNVLLANTGPLTLAGTLSAPGQDVALEDNANITETTGLIIAGTLDSGSTALGGNLLLPNANTIGALGALTLSTGTLNLVDATGLTIAGALNAPQISITTGSTLTEAATGTITTGTLTLPTIAGDVSLLTSGNNIATLADAAAAGNIALTDNQALTLDGLITAGAATAGTIALADTGSVTELPGGTLAAAALSVTAGTGPTGLISLLNPNLIGTLQNLSAPQNISFNDATAYLIAGQISTAGTLALEGDAFTESGAITAADLTSIGPINGDAVLNGTNNITTLQNFTASGAFLLADTTSLAIAGLIDAATTFGLSVLGPVTESGAITAATLTTDAGLLSTATLNGANTIGALGDITATTLLLTDTAPLALTGVIDVSGQLGLAIAGALTQTDGALTAGTLTTDGGAITGPASLTLAANNIAAIGDASFSGAFALNDAETLAIAGLLTTGGTLTLTDQGDITQTTGAISAPAVNAYAQNIFLGGLNNIATLDNVSATTNATIASTDPAGLTLAGLITAGDTLSLTSGYSLTELSSSNLTAASAYLTSTGPASFAGANRTTGNFVFSSPNGAFTQTGGAINAGTGIDLTAGGGITQTQGAIAGQSISLASSSFISVAGFVSATGALAITTPGILTDGAQYLSAGTAELSGSTIILGGDNVVTGPLTVTGDDITQPGAGTLISTTAPASLAATRLITLAGLDSFAAGVILTAPAISQSATGDLKAAYANLNATSNIYLGGALSLAGALDLTAGGTLDDQAKNLTANSALFTAPQITLDGANTLTTLLTATATGDITQDTGANNAILSAGASLTAQNITLNGTDSFAGELFLQATQAFIHTSAQTLTAATLAGTFTGIAAQTVDLTGQTDLGTIGSFIMADSTFILDNNNSLTILGPLAANQVSITATGQITLDGSPQGGLFISGQLEGKSLATPGTLDSVLEVLPFPNSGTPSISQTGTFFINAGPEAALVDAGSFASQIATLFLTAGQNDNLNLIFAPAVPPDTNGLYGPSISVRMSLGNAGIGTGNADLLNIVVLSAGDTQMTGVLDGLGGQAGAGKGFVVPNPKAVYQFNACPLGSVNCVILPTETLPSASPLQNFDVTQRKRKHLAKSVVLPGVATRDF